MTKVDIPQVQNIPSVFKVPMIFEDATELDRPTPGQTKYTPSPRFSNPIIIKQEELNFLTASTYHPPPWYFMPQIFKDEEAASTTHNAAADIDIEYFGAPVVHPTTGETISKYQTLAKDIETWELWTIAFGK